MVRILPGDVATLMVAGGQDSGASSRNEETIQAIRRSLNLDQPLHVQYGHLARGRSRAATSASPTGPNARSSRRSAARCPSPLELAVLSVLISVLVGLPLGIVSRCARTPRSTTRDGCLASARSRCPTSGSAPCSCSLPLLWFGWIPTYPLHAAAGRPVGQPPADGLPRGGRSGVHNSGPIMRITRSSMLEVLRQDYVRTAWAKGLREAGRLGATP